MAKPRRGIFAKAVSQAQTTAEHCIYVSENADETLAAQAAGLRALRIAPDGSELANVASWLASYETNAATV